MGKNFLKSLVVLMTIALILSSFGMGAFANKNNEKKQNIGNGKVETVVTELAELYGSYDFSSEAIITVIVELKEESIVEAKHTGKFQSKEKLKSERDKVSKDLTNKVNGARVNREYDYIFSGFSVDLPANEIPQLLAIPGVKAVYPNVEYTTTEVGTTSVIGEEEFSPNMLNSAPFIGSQEAWDAGFTGKGIVVAVIDTGVDYNHPDLAERFGDYKGWDFVDNDNDPQETLPGDPRGAATDHGTHVAGTIAANGGIKGVAPDATLLAYRVLGPGGSGTTTNVLAGIERAVLDKAHIMNLSLGNSLNNPDFATSIALDWAMAEGVVAVVANGNNGPNNWTVGSPGASRRAISVGATQLPYNVYKSAISISDEVSYTSPEVMGFPNDKAIADLNGNKYEFVNVGLGLVADFAGLDLTGKVALISRGSIPFVEKSDNAKAVGAIATIIYNNAPGQIEHFVAGISLPTIKISGTDGEKMLAELAAGNKEVTFNIQLDSRVGETMADFSSRGPVMDTWMIKPDVSAPGVAINSTIRDGLYGSKQGTSMASPHVAGAAALILQANPSWIVEEVKAALMNTAEKMINPATGKSYPHNTQGAGSIRVVEAINTKTLVLPGSHSFGVFYQKEEKEVGRQKIEIKNLSKETKRYNFDVEFAGNPEGIKISTSNNLQVRPNSKQQVNFNVKVDTAKLKPGYYEGTIKIAEGNNVIEVPTILFVGEPDYLRVTGLWFDIYPDKYDITVYLPGGADKLDIWVHQYNPATGRVGAYLGDAIYEENVPKQYNTFEWQGLYGNRLAPGHYVFYVYAEKAGVATTRGYIVEIK